MFSSLFIHFSEVFWAHNVWNSLCLLGISIGITCNSCVYAASVVGTKPLVLVFFWTLMRLVMARPGLDRRVKPTFRTYVRACQAHTRTCLFLFSFPKNPYRGFLGSLGKEKEIYGRITQATHTWHTHTYPHMRHVWHEHTFHPAMTRHVTPPPDNWASVLDPSFLCYFLFRLGRSIPAGFLHFLGILRQPQCNLGATYTYSRATSRALGRKKWNLFSTHFQPTRAALLHITRQ